MYIRRVVFDNIFGFKDAEVSFAPSGSGASSYPGWSVATGDNGAGKTALLRAITIALLGPEQARGLVPDFGGWVTAGASEGRISVEVIPDNDYDKTHKGGYPPKALWAEIAIIRETGLWDIRPTDVYRNKKKGAMNGPWWPTTPGWFALGYGPFRRLYGSSPDAQRLMVIPGRLPRFATLFKEDATLACN